ncbi:MAG: hypothetical protein CME06_14235 [Gemmatimonadetes bacterium]|nr:hypothetical protein [Gemmatimonadota bacterium]
MVLSIPVSVPLFLLFHCATTALAGTPLELLSFNETPPEALRDPTRPSGGDSRSNELDWFLLANHCHTRASHDSSTPLTTLLAQAALHGFASINITDHRTLEACSYPSFEPSFGVIPICGEEWGSDGHAGLPNMPPDADSMDGWEIADMVPEARAIGATVIANHPFFSGDPWPEHRLSLGIEGIEVWNSIWWWPQPDDWRANQPDLL